MVETARRARAKGSHTFLPAVMDGEMVGIQHQLNRIVFGGTMAYTAWHTADEVEWEEAN
ncbi:MAG: hypothetical protein K0Q73_8802 [Paenibacillus sp.]|jgi:hypothetical protein|nr:hypothetical protein [Paenibacillus sp.]